MKENRIKEKLCYGVAENTNKKYLYIDKITIANYKEPTKVKTFMEIMGNFNFYQYNYKDAKTSDYFFWQYVDDKGEKNWQSADICVYQNDLSCVYKMQQLYEILKNTYSDLDVIVYYNDIHKLLCKIDEEIEREVK